MNVGTLDVECPTRCDAMLCPDKLHVTLLHKEKKGIEKKRFSKQGRKPLRWATLGRLLSPQPRNRLHMLSAQVSLANKHASHDPQSRKRRIRNPHIPRRVCERLFRGLLPRLIVERSG